MLVRQLEKNNLFLYEWNMRTNDHISILMIQATANLLFGSENISQV